jgi:folate-binding protein YgfZ
MNHSNEKDVSPRTGRSWLEAAFYVDRSERGRLRLRGRDRQSFLQGMVSNDVAGLKPGQGCYAFLLDATGHVLADVRVLCVEDHLLLDVEPGAAPTIAQLLDRYLITEDCKIEDVTGETAQALVGGRNAPAVLAQLGVSGAESWQEGQNAPARMARTLALVAATRLVPGPAFDIYVAADALPELVMELRAAGAAEITEAALDAFRVEAGVPRGGADLTEKILAPETGQGARAISTSKGCYVGQEIVARIDARGHTNRTFAGFLIEGETVPASGEKITAEDGKEAGWITSAVLSPTLDRPIALGYLRHEHAAPGTPVRIGAVGATVAALPLVPAD